MVSKNELSKKSSCAIYNTKTSVSKQWYEMFEDTKGLIRSSKSKNDRR